jgi:hypothetical protein
MRRPRPPVRHRRARPHRRSRPTAPLPGRLSPPRSRPLRSPAPDPSPASRTPSRSRCPRDPARLPTQPAPQPRPDPHDAPPVPPGGASCCSGGRAAGHSPAGASLAFPSSAPHPGGLPIAPTRSRRAAA